MPMFRVGILDFHSTLHVVGVDRDHSSASRLYSRYAASARPVSPRRRAMLAYPKDVLRMVEQPLRIAAIAADRLGGSSQRFTIQPRGTVTIAAKIGDLGHQAERFRALHQPRVAKLTCPACW